MVAIVLMLLASARNAPAQPASQEEIDELKRLIELQEQSIRDLKARVQELEGERPAAPPAAAAPVVAEPGAAPSPIEEAEARMRVGATYGRQSPVRDRGYLDDRQEAAARPGDYTLDPQYRGYVPVPNTVFMIKFNPKPRLDMMIDSQNAGSDFRFVPALFPIEGTAAHGGGEQFNMNGNGSQLRVDMRAPAMAGNLRIYYQNDFFGSDSRHFQYRLQHFYGQFQGILGGYTYGLFEDPDAWPDTVDYEGPNAVIFARRPLLHYKRQINDAWNFTVGLEDPDIFVDTSSQPDADLSTRAPDGGFNVRWEPGSGHAQFSTIFRSVGASGTTEGGQDVFGWGVNLAGSFDVTDRATLLGWVVYGQGVGGMGNDTSFINSDAAFDADGDLVALDYVSALGAMTYHWTQRWRSTATFGYVNLQNAGGQPDDAYDRSYYASGNLVYQLFKRVSIGGELLYGLREVKSGDEGDLIRFQLGVVYSPFD
jgi:hypothetical protein